MRLHHAFGLSVVTAACTTGAIGGADDAPAPQAPAVDAAADLAPDAAATTSRDGGQPDAGRVDASAASSCANADPPRSGLLFWLRAGVGVVEENGRVASWADQAGGAPAKMDNVDQRPTLVPGALAGKSILHFEGGRQALQRDVPINGLSGLTVAFVNATPTLWKDDPNEWCHHAGCDPQGPAGPRLISETVCSGTYEHVLWWNGNGDWTGVYLSPKREEIAFRFGNGAETYSPNPCDLVHDPWVAWPRPKSIDAAFSLTVAIHDATRNRIYVHGTKVSDTPIPGTDTTVKAGDRLDIGNGFGWVELTNHGGDVAEVLVYGRALPDAERAQLETYVHCNLFPAMAPP